MPLEIKMNLQHVGWGHVFLALRGMKRGLLACLAFFFLSGLAVGKDAVTVPESEEALGHFIRSYLLENPEVVRDALLVYEKKEVEKEEAARKSFLKEKREEIFSPKNQAILGNPSGDVTILEFFDYNCGFCRQALPDLKRLIAEDDQLRIIIKEFPILGSDSLETARVSRAVAQIAPEKFSAFHITVLAGEGTANAEKALNSARAAGVDEQALETALGKMDKNPFEDVYALATLLGLQGTPAYVIGDEVLVGAVGYARLKEKIAAQRAASNGS